MPLLHYHLKGVRKDVRTLGPLEWDLSIGFPIHAHNGDPGAHAPSFWFIFTSSIYSDSIDVDTHYQTLALKSPYVLKSFQRMQAIKYETLKTPLLHSTESVHDRDRWRLRVFILDSSL